jgi:hypothetical protein
MLATLGQYMIFLHNPQTTQTISDHPIILDSVIHLDV